MKNQKSEPKKSLNILLAISGGIAAYKCCELTRLFVKEGHSVKVIMTKHAKRFITPLTMETLSGKRVYTDLFRKESFSTEHITLSKWADCLLVAPATANVIGKFANGIADDILSTVYLSFTKPVIIAPAMHTEMYRHPAVDTNMQKLKSLGVHFIDAGSGQLASGDVGEGRLAEPAIIKASALAILGKKKEFEGLKVVITAGPTREHLDPVRFISSPSTGKMGIALAKEAYLRGANVILVHGPMETKTDLPVKSIPVTTAKDMLRAVNNNRNCDIFISAASVSDYAPKTRAGDKIKKDGNDFILSLEENPDILATFSKKYGKGKVIVGFAAETSDIISNAKSKLTSKKLDMIVANDVKSSNSGFASDTDRATLVYRNGKIESLGLLDKKNLAGIIFDRISRMIR
jgi:phosphopantothenoylcysteine decarboxylase / phosphopantothenate---cysteine ligase